ncbi:hypothetical protein [Falsirhodobacter sp. 20TX0035]|uniref:hypothetical protein n=1 Tax=Falsirhodobacter sp. 20TX0035 TaxID=3022019 RepID=UPI00232AC3FC|nr:hypothetical protein [Falsirhodobacter sp. 20TX0035]MDB6454683.1 hypothetical protein [Falsirhodobacter sp. 20TX0035]
MKAIVVLAALAWAHPALADDRQSEIMVELLNQYAEHAGSLDACGQGPGKSGVSDLSDRIAEWRFPGLWAAWFGGRSSFRDDLQVSSDLSFSLGRLNGCPSPIFIGTTRMLVDTIEQTLESEMDG